MKPTGVFISVVLGAMAMGCGKKAAPVPPQPRAPLPVKAVLARQVGERAVVGFTTPDTRGSSPGQHLVEALLVRVAYPPGNVPPGDPGAFARRGEIVGRIEGQPFEPASRQWLVDDTLAALPDAGSSWTLRYAVQLVDARGREAPLVTAEDLRPVATVPPPRGLVAEPTAHGIRLEWDVREAPSASGYNVYRSRVGEPFPDRPLTEQPLDVAEYVDTTVVTGNSYAYQVRSVLAEGSPPRESAPSETREVVAEDRFAPGAPRGLVAVQEGSAVRLFWDPNSEADVVGYRVWRREPPGAWSPIGPELLRDNTWLDKDVASGATLEYRVTALDAATPPNESEPSVERDLVIVAEPLDDGATPP